MALNFIDIASYQSAIDLNVVFSLNPLHGVIVKSTEGMKYVNPKCNTWVQWLIDHRKPWGFYHFLNGSDPRAEAERFVEDTVNYFGHGVPIADYEGGIVSSYGTYYLRRFLETVREITGQKCLVYCNLSTLQSDVNGFRQIAEEGYSLWLAQYANSRDQLGFRATPWQQGSVSPFPRITMHQYSDHGILSGYTGYLDLDLFYGDYDDWNRLASKETAPAAPEPVVTPSIPEDDPNGWILDWIEYLEDEIREKQAKVDELRRALK